MKRQSAFAAALVLATASLTVSVPASAADQVIPPELHWSFAGPFGRYDQGQLQRGFKIYREVCSACHSMNLLSFRNLADPGGPGFSEAQVKQIASEYKIKDTDDQGNEIERAGRPADHFPGHNIAMPPPLADGQVKYDDGSPETLQQYSQDVAAFLMWASEPHLNQRKR